MKQSTVKTFSSHIDTLQNILHFVEGILAEERDNYESMSERVAEGPKGDVQQDTILSLEEAQDGIETAISSLSELIPQPSS